MSETLMNTSNPLDGERVAGTVGFALPGVEVRIASEEGNALDPGAVGEIELRGPNVFSGYWRMPEKTAEEFRPDGFFRTGDMGLMDAEGRVSIVAERRIWSSRAATTSIPRRSNRSSTRCRRSPRAR